MGQATIHSDGMSSHHPANAFTRVICRLRGDIHHAARWLGGITPLGTPHTPAVFDLVVLGAPGRRRPPAVAKCSHRHAPASKDGVGHRENTPAPNLAKLGIIFGAQLAQLLRGADGSAANRGHALA
ncbi:hypothetical protein AWC25_21570 [Mycobacterium sherrisii]|uniref:Uncharacterized protein n=3 Tax=Mycobacterium sherrisii TaxID=243061 RepID=A0A1E3T9B5_9MYCO|nr:hypothetical protein BHQ21_01080 [Mycobacterium sherrisii]ORW86115.1 hypothetical protein AWC25_21570 [Mycobacterium sherrisii]